MLTEYRQLGPKIDEKTEGQRLDRYLSSHFRFLTRAGWQKRISLGEVLVNGGAKKGSYDVRFGDKVTFYHPEQAEPEVVGEIRKLWEYEGVMALFKPSGLPMHENGAYRRNTLSHLLHEKFGTEWSAVHRLDRETSGIVLCGSTYEIRKRLSLDFEHKRIHKEYLALVSGEPSESSWISQEPLGDLVLSQIRIKKWVVPDGLEAETHFFVVDKKNDFSIVRAVPKTGRTNQIRIHLAHAGHWILGDKLYHPDEEVFLDYWKHGKTTEFCVQQTMSSRLCLHAAHVTFNHPVTGEVCSVDAPLPEDLQDLWLSLTRTHATGHKTP